MSKSPKKSKGRDERAPVFMVQLSGANAREDVEELTRLIRNDTGLVGVSMAAAVLMAVRAELARRKGKGGA